MEIVLLKTDIWSIFGPGRTDSNNKNKSN